jgi:dihydrodipicolinate synthase/N-acetylneuraminate lyase
MSELLSTVVEQLKIKAIEPLNKVLSVTSNTADVKKAMELLGKIMAVVNPKPAETVKSEIKSDPVLDDAVESKSFKI